MQEAGFRDSWRVLHPDPAAKPGLTWWAGRPPLAAYAPGENDAQDRIDQVWFAGEAVPVAARVVGESGGPGVTIEIDPWPSDHRAVLVDFTVQAAPMPGLLTTDRHVYLEGERVEVRYAFTSEVAGPITIRNLVNDVMLLSQAPGAAQGRFEWAPRTPGHYGARAAAGGTSYEREFWVLARDAVPAVELDSDVYLPGEPVEVRWRNAPGYRNDYIALFPADSTGKEGEMLGFAYLRARPEGRMDLRHALGNSGGLLTPGRYQVRLMKDDGYEAMAVSDIFEIR